MVDGIFHDVHIILSYRGSGLIIRLFFLLV